MWVGILKREESFFNRRILLIVWESRTTLKKPDNNAVIGFKTLRAVKCPILDIPDTLTPIVITTLL
jgi:hypothetical protein